MVKPEVTVLAPPALVSGSPASLEIVVTAHDDTKIEFIRARLTGEQQWAIGSGKSRRSRRMFHPQLEADLMGMGVLLAGSTRRFSVTFPIPADVPPSHAVGPARARMSLRVHVSIPWRVDVRADFDLPVRLPASNVVRTPVITRSTPWDAPHDEPRMELSLASSRLIAGETLVGTCALFHVDDRAPREVELAIVPALDLFGYGRGIERRGAGFASTLTLPAGTAGTGVPFKLSLPATITPSFAAANHQLSWWLTARTGSWFKRKLAVSVPLEIIDASAAATTPSLTAAPQLGDERIAKLFAELASLHEGWHVQLSGGEDADPLTGELALARELADCHLTLAYDYRGEDGTFLVARIDHPSLGLGLSVTPSSSLRHVFFQDIEVDIAGWDRVHLVDARFAEQAVPVLKMIVPSLVRTTTLGTLVRWSDDALVCELAMASIDVSRVAHALAALEDLAGVIAMAQRTVAPPPGIVVDEPAWRDFARDLDGTLASGDLSITGRFQGVPVELGLTWDDALRPIAVVVRVGDPAAASAELRSIVLSLPRPVADVLGAPSASQLVEMVVSWPDDITDLEVHDGVASARLRLASGDAPTVSAERARQLVGSLRAVLVALDPGHGPYR